MPGSFLPGSTTRSRSAGEAAIIGSTRVVKVRPQVLAGTYIRDSVSITVGEAADAWLAHCRVRRDAGRRMERMTYVGYEIYVRCHIKDGKVGVGDVKLSRLTRKAVAAFCEL